MTVHPSNRDLLTPQLSRDSLCPPSWMLVLVVSLTIRQPFIISSQSTVMDGQDAIGYHCGERQRGRERGRERQKERGSYVSCHREPGFHPYQCGGREKGTQQTRDIQPMLVQCWASVKDDGSALCQHWLNVSCLLGRREGVEGREGGYACCTSGYVGGSSTNFYSSKKSNIKTLMKRFIPVWQKSTIFSTNRENVLNQKF